MQKSRVDIAIVSAGTAGLAAAVTAAENGVSVAVIEKTGAAGGTGRMAGGLFAVESRLQNEKQYALSKEEVFNTYMEFTHWRVNARLVKTVIDMSGDTIKWLEGMGVEFLNIFPHGVGNYYTWHVVKGPCSEYGYAGAANAMMAVLAAKAKQYGAEIYLKTPVTKIDKEGDSVSGVIASDTSGNQIQIEARAVILATGGHSIGMVPGMPGGIGDGIRLAREAGAAVTESPNTIVMGKMPAFKGPPNMSPILQITDQPVLFVNLLGERFMNEELVLSPVFPGNAICRQPEQHGFGIFDADTAEYYYKKGLQPIASGPKATGIAENFDEELKIFRKNNPDHIADSLEELCDKTGISFTGLRQTLAEYNLACETGRDYVFNKKAKYLHAVKRPPFFYNMRNGNSVLSWNGIKVNHRTEVLTPDWNIISGLYAAGMDIASEWLHDTYPFMFPGTAMGFAVNSGRISAINALNYINNK